MIKRYITLLFLLLGLAVGSNNIFADEDPDIVDVWGTSFGLINLHFQITKSGSADKKQKTQLKEILDKYLRWSGIFKIQDSPLPSDLVMIVEYGYRIRVSIKSNQGEELYRANTARVTDKNVAGEIRKLLEDIIFRLTGQKSIFKSAIAYIKKGDTVGYQLTLIDLFASNEKILVNDGEINVLPRWKHDATGIMYTSLRRSGGKLIYFDLATNQSKLLVKHDKNLGSGTWDRSGKKLVVSLANKGNTDLYLIDPVFGNLQLTFRSSIESNPNLSPDGKRLLFVSNRSGSIQIYQKIFATGETLRMTFKGSYNVDPRWSNDGNYIVYAGIVNNRFQVFFMDKDGIRIKQITSGKNSAEQPVWSPDGRQIMYTSKIDGAQKLFVMRIDGSFKRRVTKSGKGISEINPAWISEYRWP
jgi:TolB protein